MRGKIKTFLKHLLCYTPVLKHIFRTRGTAAPIRCKYWFIQKVLGFNREAYWPMHPSSLVSGVKNISIGIGTAPGLSPGCYIQGLGKIEIGDYTIIAPNVGIVSANHSLYDYTEHVKGSVKIGRYCWIGMNAVILPGVVLGDHTVVAAGTVVTRSFEDGYCVIAGNPARCLKLLEKDKCVERRNRWEYRGYKYC